MVDKSVAELAVKWVAWWVGSMVEKRAGTLDRWWVEQMAA